MAVARRSHLVLAVAAMAIVVAGCAAINEVVTGRDLNCGTVPEDVCIRAADLADRILAGDVRHEFPTGEYTIVVSQDEICDPRRPSPDAVRCFGVTYTRSVGSGMGIIVGQLTDGTIVTN